MADNWFILLKVIRYRLQLDTSSIIFMGCFAANSLYFVVVHGAYIDHIYLVHDKSTCVYIGILNWYAEIFIGL